MKKLYPIVLVLIALLISTVTYAQKVKRKNASSKFTVFPMLSMDNINSYKIQIYPGELGMSQNDLKKKKGLKSKMQAAQDNINNVGGPAYFGFKTLNNVENGQDINIEVAFGKFEIVGKTLREHDIMCVYKGADLTKKGSYVACPAYYYEVNYSYPAILRITDKTGGVLYAKKLDPKGSGNFAYSETGGHLKVGDLEAAYAAGNVAEGIAKSAVGTKLDKLADAVNRALFFYKADEKHQIATGSGDFEYSALGDAQKLAIETYNNMGKEKGGSENLTKCISTWETEVAKLNRADKKAEINIKIAMGLRENIAVAYYSLCNFDKAIENIDQALSLQKIVTNKTREPIMSSFRSNLLELKAGEKGYTENTLGTTPVPTNLILENIRVKEKAAAYKYIGGGDMIAVFQADYEKYSAANKVAKAAAAPVAKASASGGNKYRSKIIIDATGTKLICTKWTEKFDVVPAEICELLELTQLNIVGLNIAKLPACIGDITNLKRLILSKNKLTGLPAEIGKLSNLETLDISENSITSLPMELTKCANLKKIKVGENSISNLADIQAAMPKCKIK